jgi:hypothetical protein
MRGSTPFKCNVFHIFNSTKKYPDPIMSDINITNHGIAKLLSNLDPSKAAGPR